MTKDKLYKLILIYGETKYWNGYSSNYLNNDPIKIDSNAQVELAGINVVKAIEELECLPH